MTKIQRTTKVHLRTGETRGGLGTVPTASSPFPRVSWPAWRRHLCGVLALVVALPSEAEPYRPKSPDTVLLRLPGLRQITPATEATPVNPTRSSLSAPGRVAPSDPLETARALVLAARRESDPRLLARARQQLRADWDNESVPAEFAVLRAEIRQGLHDFASAQRDVDSALRNAPRHPGAWVLKASLHQLRGEYDLARTACLAATRFADPLTATTLAASLAGLSDASESPASRLASALERNPDAAPDIRAWANVSLAELLIRGGRNAEAEARLNQALSLEPGQPYALAVLADLHLATGKPSEVARLLRDAKADGLRLRLAEALMVLAPDAPETLSVHRQLAEAFALASRRGDELHLREHARFELRIAGRPERALQLARRNWSIQKEPADLLLFLEAAVAAGDAEAERDIRAWARMHQPAVIPSVSPSSHASLAKP